MRSAEKIIGTILSQKSMSGSVYIPIITITEAINIINEARIEAIKESAEVVRLKYENCGDIKTCGCHGSCERPFISINKQSIISLIKQVK